MLPRGPHAAACLVGLSHARASRFHVEHQPALPAAEPARWPRGGHRTLNRPPEPPMRGPRCRRFQSRSSCTEPRPPSPASTSSGEMPLPGHGVATGLGIQRLGPLVGRSHSGERATHLCARTDGSPHLAGVDRPASAYSYRGRGGQPSADARARTTIGRRAGAGSGAGAGADNHRPARGRGRTSGGPGADRHRAPCGGG